MLLFVHETYRNFGYPLKSWKHWLQALDRVDLDKTVKAAQDTYLSTLQNLEKKFREGALTAEQASTQVQRCFWQNFL